MAENHMSGKVGRQENDWELSEEYYCEKGVDLSLEEFITDEEAGKGGLQWNRDQDALLKKTADDVHCVLAMTAGGKTIAQIASETGMEETYVYDILVCAQGFREDDEIAVAHLLLG